VVFMLDSFVVGEDSANRPSGGAEAKPHGWHGAIP